MNKVIYRIRFGASHPGWWTLYDEIGPVYHIKTVQEIIALLPKDNHE